MYNALFSTGMKTDNAKQVCSTPPPIECPVVPIQGLLPNILGLRPLRQSYDYLTIMPMLRSNYDKLLNILRKAQGFLGTIIYLRNRKVV